MNAQESELNTSTPIRLTVRKAELGDITAALRAALADMKARPGLSLFFGLTYALFGAVMLAGLGIFDQVWIAIAAAVGFPLVAPFLAAGLYEMSRRQSRGMAFSARDIFLVIFSQQRREFGWMSFVVLFVFWMWAYQVRIILAITLSSQPIGSLDGLLTTIFATWDGFIFLSVGSVVGAVIATVLFSITVTAMPLLLDKTVDFVTAMITSVKTVLESPIVMLGWGAAVGVLTLFAVGSAFIGVIVIFPLLGHATWHLYERLVVEE